MIHLNRRNFIQNSSSALAGLSAVSAMNPSRVLGANDKINVASIGVKSQGFSVTRNFVKSGRANIVAMCDVDSKILENRAGDIAQAQDVAPQTTSDYRKILENKDVDAVIIGTPDHWHAIIALEAIAAGKDIYIEKPCAQTVHECRMIAKAAEKHNRIVQHGTQQRSGKHFQEAKAYVQSGKLGKIAMVRNWAILGRGSIGKKSPQPAPAHIDYDRWLGPAPKRPYTENRCHYNWRFMWDYGTGDMGNWGVHWMDIALWTMELGWPTSVVSSAGMHVFDDDKETPDTQVTLYEYPNLTMVWELRMWSKQGIEGRGTGTAFYGDQQTLIVNRGGWEAIAKDGTKVAEGKSSNNSGLDHVNNFMDCVQSRKLPIADIASGHISAGVAVLGNVAYLADEKIRYDAVNNTLADQSKNHLITREYRKPWQLPKI